MKTIKIIDNFLDKKDFRKIDMYMVKGYEYAAPHIQWYYISLAGGVDEEYQFIYPFPFSRNVREGNPEKEHHYFLKVINPIFEKLGIELSDLIKLRANLIPKNNKIIEHRLHTDIESEEVHKFITGIFYLNTNNGYTHFEDGTKIESIANRLILFPTSMKHGGTTCTDSDTRVVLNMNYKEKE